MSTKISWTNECLNPIVGCSHAAYTDSDGRKVAHPGCGGYGDGEPRCYAERTCSRQLPGFEAHNRAAVDGRWTGRIEFMPERLAWPFTHLRFRPRRDGRRRLVFLCSLSDMGHPAVPDEVWMAINGMMVMAGHLIFQDLTKRADVQRERLEKWTPGLCAIAAFNMFVEHNLLAPGEATDRLERWVEAHAKRSWFDFPHVRRYVSVSDQETADALVPELLRIPGAFWGISQEPQVGPVTYRSEWLDRLSHIIVGGQSGHGARPFDLEWARATIRQCREAGVPVFVKQLGKVPMTGARCACNPDPCFCDDGLSRLYLRDAAGADPLEWPEDLRVQEQPEVMR